MSWKTPFFKGGVLKSHESGREAVPSDFREVIEAIYTDCSVRCSASPDLRDLKTIRSRIEHEGMSFLTITLPDFCSAFEKSLADGYFDPQILRRFRRSGSIPAFMQGMIGLLFDQGTGRILNVNRDVSSTVVASVRQVCLAFKKVELPCSRERERKVVRNFIEVEQSNRDFSLSEEDLSLFREVSACLWHNLLGSFNPSELLPRHGPGATAEGIRGNSKYRWQFWYERLERLFPILEYGYSCSAADSQDFDRVAFVSEADELPAKVALVPKTLKGPRLIAIEPVCMQYAQQAVKGFLYRKLETYWLTRGQINFSDQTINQLQALESSSTGREATLDLSDASDRVLWSLVQEMLACNPDFLDYVSACRTRSAQLADGTTVGPLAKFASMGSALCFPIESMYFYTICVVARLRKHALPVDAKSIYQVTRGIFVYGDDLVVPTEDVEAVLLHLQKYHCKVNARKSFWTGKFRESCGMDAYDGVKVTPTYVRTVAPKDRQQAGSIVSWIATANQFKQTGCHLASSLMFHICERALRHQLPYVSETSPLLGRVSSPGLRSVDRWNDRYHSWEAKGWTPSLVYRCDRIDGYPALQKCLLKLESREVEDLAEDTSEWPIDPKYMVEPMSVDKKHLERSARRGAVTLKLRWAPAT